MIKIAFVIDQLATGGTERQLKYLMEGLNHQKFETVLYILRGDSQHAMRPKGIVVNRLGIESILSFPGASAFIKFANSLRHEKFDIVQTFFQDATLLGITAAKIARLPKTVVSYRDMLFWAKPLNFRIHKSVSNLADYLLANSHTVGDNLKAYFPNKQIKIIYNGIPLKSAQKAMSDKVNFLRSININKNLPVITLVSNCNRPVKRVDVLIEAANLLLKSVDAFFLVVGDGYLRPSLEKHVRSLGIANFVRFLGNREDIDHILYATDIALNTSDSEGFSNSILEAMRAGVPVVASDIPGNRELVIDGQTGLLFKAGDPYDLTSKLLSLLNDQQISDALGHAGHYHLKNNFSMENMIASHETFYQRILE